MTRLPRYPSNAKVTGADLNLILAILDTGGVINTSSLTNSGTTGDTLQATVPDVTGSISPPPGTTGSPATVRGLTGAYGIDNFSQTHTAYVLLSWTPNPVSDFISRYDIYYHKGSDPTLYNLSVGGDVNSARINNLFPGNSYAFSVQAHDATNRSSIWCPEINVIVSLDADAPSIPTGLTATSTSTGVYLTWTEVGPDGISDDLKQYQIAVSLDGGGTYPTVRTVGPGNAYFYTPTTANQGTVFFKIATVDWTGNVSDYSSAVSASTGTILGPILIENGTSIDVELLRIGRVNPINTGTLPDYGGVLFFSGGPSGGAFDSDNSDPLAIARYNVASNKSELRIGIGNDPGSTDDTLSIGSTVGGSLITGTWAEKHRFDAAGNDIHVGYSQHYGDYSSVVDNIRIGSSTAATKGGWIGFQDAGTNKWELGKESSNTITLWDSVRAASVFQIASNGDMTLMPSAGNVVIGGSGFLKLAPASSKIIPGSTQLSLRNNADSADNLLIVDAGDITGRTKFTMPGPLVLTTATSKIIPGATSLSLRNNADSADNLLISDAGGVTTRAGLTVASGNFSISAATSKIVPGATSLSHRNNADNADNLLINDAGDATMRSSLSIPPSAGGTVASTSYGSVPVLIDVQSPTGASFDFPNPLPTGFRNLKIKYYARESGAVASDFLNIRFNNDSGANYDSQRNSAAGTVNTAAEQLASTLPAIGLITGASATANYFSIGEITIPQYNNTTGNKLAVGLCAWADTNTTGHQTITTSMVKWRTTATAITRITLLAGTGNFVTGSVFELWGEP